MFAENGRIKTTEGMALAGDTQIGGYYLIDVPGEPEATGWALTTWSRTTRASTRRWRGVRGSVAFMA